MASIKAKDNKRQSSLYENSLPQGCQVIELSHISTNTYDSLRRGDAVETDNGGQYETVSVNTTGNNSSPQALNRDEESARQGTILRAMVAHPGRMIVVAVVGVLVLTVIGVVISGVIVYRTLNAKIEELERERQTQYAEDNTNNRLETLDSLIQELNNRSDVSMGPVQLEINDVKAELSRFQNIWSKELVSLRANDSNTLDIIMDTNSRLETLDNLIQELKKHSEVKSAFSVWYPHNITSGHLSFSRTNYNYGGDFSASTGVFTCSKPGVYYFSVSLTKKRNYSSKVDLVKCYLYRNSGNVLRIEVDPTDDDTDKGSASVSNSALLDMNRGDTVSLQQCSNPPSTYMEPWSSFTGFLLYADP